MTEEARRARDEAVDRVERNANEAWKERAYNAVVAVADRLHEFTTDDVWAELAQATETTHERRAMGAVIQRAARAGLISNTGRVRKSVRPECHQNPKAIWTTSPVTA